MSNFENFIENLPDFAKDMKLNAKSVILGNGTLTKKQIAFISVACAAATKNKVLAKDVLEHFSSTLSEQEISASQAAATIMGMNNVYYRFIHLVSDKSYETMPAGLRMNAISSHGVEKVDFEFASLAVSAINGCGMCIDSHERTLKKHNVTSEQIQYAVKIASVINSLSSL